MANKKQEQSGGSSDNATKKDGDTDQVQDGELEKEQEKFIQDTKETEKLIDPGNEHHHCADDADKKIG